MVIHCTTIKRKKPETAVTPDSKNSKHPCPQQPLGSGEQDVQLPQSLPVQYNSRSSNHTFSTSSLPTPQHQQQQLQLNNDDNIDNNISYHGTAVPPFPTSLDSNPTDSNLMTNPATDNSSTDDSNPTDSNSMPNSTTDIEFAK